MQCRRGFWRAPNTRASLRVNNWGCWSPRSVSLHLQRGGAQNAEPLPGSVPLANGLRVVLPAPIIIKLEFCNWIGGDSRAPSSGPREPAQKKRGISNRNSKKTCLFLGSYCVVNVPGLKLRTQPSASQRQPAPSEERSAARPNF